MNQAIQNLAEQLGIPLPKPVSEAELNAFETEFGFQLPPSLRSLYTTCDGLVIDKQLKVNTLHEVHTQWIPGFRQYGIPEVRHYFPFTDNNDSNPFCVCCDDIMAGYVVNVFHDDAAQVKFRTSDSFLVSLGVYLQAGKWDLHVLPSEFDMPQRAVKDIETGLQLLEQAQHLEDVERHDAFNFGMRLLSEQQIDQVISLLEDKDVYVSQDAQKRLKAMNTPVAQKALDDFRKTLEDFTKQCAEHLRLSGIPPTIIEPRTYHIRLDPGPVWMDMHVFYAMRHEHPDILDFVVKRAVTFLEMKRQEKH